MPVQKYTGREFSRSKVQRRAEGMTRDEVAEQTEVARAFERQKGRALEEPGRLQSLRLAEWAHTEWRRIGYVMAEQGLAVYSVTADAKALQWEQQRIERIAAERGSARGN
ncbi:hypothetical protein [Streptomyces vinaceus]|uniref:hypothetical protein n=1 Tax=Streptomyces vinaceus TaxID=1960 RepID=UPI0036A9A832